eukprot:scaffold6922_cov363-Prasinococcus_capsulatus_cf.AAC.3
MKMWLLGEGVALLHSEPLEARPPDKRWRLYIFKNGQPLDACAASALSYVPANIGPSDPLHIHRQSCYLFGRDRKVVDVPTDHPSCSKQHAVLQFRLTQKTGSDGDVREGIRPYLMDLGSTNGTSLNVSLGGQAHRWRSLRLVCMNLFIDHGLEQGERVEAERYYELLEQDMLK